MRKISLLAAAAVAASIVGAANAGTIVFSDNFNRASLGATWTITKTGTGNDFGASIVTNRAQLTNDATAATNQSGSVSMATALTGFTGYGIPPSALFHGKLNANQQYVEWTLNMQQIRPDPAGYATGGSYGAAFILAGTNANFSGAGQGYAIVYGQSGTTDPIRLATYNNGLSGTLTNIITATGALTDVGAEYMSLKVRYTVATNNWQLWGRNDSGSFADPATGTLTSLGTIVNSTYTNVTMTHMGAEWNGSTSANQTALFDNFTVSVPEPTSLSLLGLGAAGLLLRRRKTA